MVDFGHLKDIITKYYLKFFGLSFEGKKTYQYGEVSEDIYTFSQEEPGKLAQCVPVLDTIIYWKGLFENYSEKVQDIVFLHEYRHSTQNMIYKILSILAIPLAILFFSSLLSSLVVVPLLILKEKILYAISMVFAVIMAYALVAITHWPAEIDAELFVYKKIGKSDYIKEINKIKTKRKKGTLKRFIDIVMYPPKKLPLWIFGETVSKTEREFSEH